MRAILVNGVLWIPVRLDAEDGTIGEGMFICEKDDPEYEKWLEEAIVMKGDNARGYYISPEIKEP